MDNPILIVVAICIRKYIFPESREKTLHKEERYICKIFLPYKEMIAQVVQEEIRLRDFSSRALAVHLSGEEEAFVKFW